MLRTTFKITREAMWKTHKNVVDGLVGTFIKLLENNYITPT